MAHDESKIVLKKPKLETKHNGEPKQNDVELSMSSNNCRDESEMEMLQGLSCSICVDIIHNCVGLQPCGHCFCAGCFSDWVQRSNRCPECRLKVFRAAKNHRLDNLVDIFLKNHPERKRSDDDIHKLDVKNRITSDLYHVPKNVGSYLNVSSSESSLSSDDDVDDSSSDDSSARRCCLMKNIDNRLGRKSVISGVTKNDGNNSRNDSASTSNAANRSTRRNFYQIPVCAQCPSYGQTVGLLIRQPRCQDLPNYVCTIDQQHVKCHCCGSFMPDRQNDANLIDRPIRCKACMRTFCYQYFGCTHVTGQGCLQKFKDFELLSDERSTIINGNYFETSILLKHLGNQKIDFSDFFNECLTKLDAGEFNCKDKQSADLKSDTMICRDCFLNNFQDLAYEYRTNIEIMDDSINNRPNCWYGKKCRTQKHKHDHARRLNHVCDQTRF